MKNIDEIKLLMYRSFDGPLTGAEQKRLDEALSRSAELRKEREEALLLRKQLEEWAPDGGETVPERVMALFEQDQSIEAEYFSLFKKVLLSGIAAVVLLLLSIWISEGSLSYDSLTGIAGYQPETEMILPLNN